jgi:hypothetical protein
VVSKKKLRSEIEKVKIRDIKSLRFSKYEDAWGKVRSELEREVLGAKTDHISELHKEYLMMFYTALDWRSMNSNIQFNFAVE